MTTNDNVLTPDEFAFWQKVVAAAVASGKSEDKALHLADLSVAAGRQAARQAHEEASEPPVTPSQLREEMRLEARKKAWNDFLDAP